MEVITKIPPSPPQTVTHLSAPPAQSLQLCTGSGSSERGRDAAEAPQTSCLGGCHSAPSLGGRKVLESPCFLQWFYFKALSNQGKEVRGSHFCTWVAERKKKKKSVFLIWGMIW